MKRLQINVSGAWRNVLDYPEGRDSEVRAAAAPLARIVSAKLRTLDANGKVLLYWSHDAGWHIPQFAQQ